MHIIIVKFFSIFSIVFIFVLVSSIVMTQSAFANHLEITIRPTLGSTTGCEDTVDGCYIPSIATVDVGSTIIFLNTDITAHTFTAGTVRDGPSNEFDTGLLMTGDSFEYHPDTIGEIPYMCTIHPWMEGLIIVQK